MMEKNLEGVELDDLLHLLTDRSRRRLLVALLEHNPQDEDSGVPVDVTTSDEELEKLRLEVSHTHLPKLEAAEVIEWDRDAGEVSKGPRFDELRPLLELMYENADRLPDKWL